MQNTGMARGALYRLRGVTPIYFATMRYEAFAANMRALQIHAEARSRARPAGLRQSGY